MKKLAIIGYGRFGELLAHILKDDFDVLITETNPAKQKAATNNGFVLIDLQKLSEADIIIPAVPISALESTLTQLAGHTKPGQTIMDVCSVKFFPAKLMQKLLPQCNLLATHPLFGPDSARDGLAGLKIALCPINSDDTLDFWQNFWQTKGVQAIQTTPEKHDHDMIYSLGLTQTLARIFGGMSIPDLDLTTKSYDAVKQVADYSLSDTDQLYHDMLYYNPFFGQMKNKLVKSIKETTKNLELIGNQQKNAISKSAN